MNFWAGLAIFVVACIILRAIRSLTVVADYIAYALVLAGFIWAWIENGFGWGLLMGFLPAIVVFLLFGMLRDGTKVRYNGKNYDLRCDKCNYEDLEIISQSDNYITTKCRRCGKVKGHILE